MGSRSPNLGTKSAPGVGSRIRYKKIGGYLPPSAPARLGKRRRASQEVKSTPPGGSIQRGEPHQVNSQLHSSRSSKSSPSGLRPTAAGGEAGNLNDKNGDFDGIVIAMGEDTDGGTHKESLGLISNNPKSGKKPSAEKRRSGNSLPYQPGVPSQDPARLRTGFLGFCLGLTALVIGEI